METNHKHHENCECKPSALSTAQNFDEMDFERGIWTAAVYNEIDRLRSFIEKRCTNDRDNSGYTALHYAARNGHFEACELLLRAGAEVNAQTNGGATSLHRAAFTGRFDIVKLLLKSGADCRITDQDGRTALHCASEKGDSNIIALLIDTDKSLKYMKDIRNKVPYDLLKNKDQQVADILDTSL